MRQMVCRLSIGPESWIVPLSLREPKYARTRLGARLWCLRRNRGLRRFEARPDNLAPGIVMRWEHRPVRSTR